MLASGCNYNKFYDLDTQKDVNNSDIIDNVEKTINLIYLKSKNKNKPFSVYKEIINLLIKSNTYLNDKNNSNMTPFILASMYGNKEILELMIDNGSNISEKDEFGNNALLYSARSGNYDTFKYLISKGIDINYENNNKNNALILASSYNNFDIVKELISKGVNINGKNNLNET
ncbi:MAG: ankyrin repeat domain-containing protein, partial [Candidatus Sericytochromatia bacterium]